LTKLSFSQFKSLDDAKLKAMDRFERAVENKYWLSAMRREEYNIACIEAFTYEDGKASPAVAAEMKAKDISAKAAAESIMAAVHARNKSILAVRSARLMLKARLDKTTDSTTTADIQRMLVVALEDAGCGP